MILKCHCGADITSDHPQHRGRLANLIASLSGGLVVARERLATLKSKRWSKQFARQRELDQALMAALEAQIARDEQLLRLATDARHDLYGD